MKPLARLVQSERTPCASFNPDLSTPEHRRGADIYTLRFDHAGRRKVWNNLHPIAPDVCRSNQPTHERLVKYKKMGIKSVLNLRGAADSAHYLVERESCEQLGLTLVDISLRARTAASREDLQKLITAFRSIEKPFIIHGKSGADRAGFASAIYQIAMLGTPVSKARKMVSFKNIHPENGRTGVFDYILAAYGLRNAQSPIDFEDWINTEYDGPGLQASFDAKGKSWF